MSPFQVKYGGENLVHDYGDEVRLRENLGSGDGRQAVLARSRSKMLLKLKL